MQEGRGGVYSIEAVPTTKACELVLRSLIQVDEGLNTCRLILVAGGASTPWATIDAYFSILEDADYGFVIVKQCGTRYVLSPEATVGAFACTAYAEE